MKIPLHLYRGRGRRLSDLIANIFDNVQQFYWWLNALTLHPIHG